MDFYIPPSMTNTRLRIAVAGVGGSGGEMLDALTRLDFGLRALGGQGIHVTAFDEDRVEAHNVGRQRFSMADVGYDKAICLVNRINMFYGFDWEAEPRFFKPEKEELQDFDIIIGCVDKAAFRVKLGEIAKKLRRTHRNKTVLWLDLGNGQHQGQAVLGHVCGESGVPLWLPTVLDLYPTLNDPVHDMEGPPRCSLAEALTGADGQDLYVNRTLVDMSMNILWALLTKGRIDRHGVHIDVQTLQANPILIDPAAWAFYGYAA